MPVARQPCLKKYERPGLAGEELEEIKECFDLFDVDGINRVDPRDLSTALHGLFEKNAVVRQIVQDLEKHGHGPMTFGEFVELMTARLGERDSREDISKVFKLFDIEYNGHITEKNLTRIAAELGEALTATEINEMIQRADNDGDGVINMEDFYTLMSKRTFQ